jgi:hypothetical protein
MMVKCWVHGTNITRAAANKHHITPQAAGGSDDKKNLIFLCVNCHSVLHRCEELLASGKGNLTSELIATTFPDSTGARSRMKQLVAEARSAFQDADESGLASDKASVELDRDLFDKIQLLAQEVRDPRTGRKVGVSRYVSAILEKHLRSRGISYPVKG